MPGEMGKETHKKVEIVGTSTVSVSEAIENAIDRASVTLEHLEWFEITSIRGYIADTDVEYQVEMKVGFQLE